MLCTTIVTGREIILQISFAQNGGLKFNIKNIKIQMPHFHNTHKYCGNEASGLAT